MFVVAFPDSIDGLERGRFDSLLTEGCCLSVGLIGLVVSLIVSLIGLVVSLVINLVVCCLIVFGRYCLFVVRRESAVLLGESSK